MTKSLISSLYVDSMHRKCIEPVKRAHGNGLQWQSHRFAIKGGISFREAMLRDLSEPNVLLVAWRAPPGERAPLFSDVSFRGIPVRIVDDFNPPYLPETRSPANKYDLKHRMYRHELTPDGHVALLAFLTILKGMVILSGYPHPMYDQALPGWRRVERAALADGARPRTEVLWINPACAAALDHGTLHSRMEAAE